MLKHKHDLLPSQEREEELRLLADAMEQDFPHLQRTVRYYRSLLEPVVPLKPYPRLAFLEHAPNAGRRWCQIRLGDRPPQPKPHCLEVVFHRAQG
jgi:hypothetical protein